MRYLITGATGFVGGHVAESCVERGHTVSAIVRPTSNTADLEKWGVNLLQGELNDGNLLRQAVLETDVVVHCAAKIGDWGPLSEYRQVNVDMLRGLLDACKGQALSRFIHMSSLGVYGMRHHYGTDENEPPSRRHHDAYSQSKAEAEEVALHYQRQFGVPVVVLRPGFVYGPRDKTVLPNIIENLKAGRIRYPGAKGHRALNTIFVRNLVDAVFLAVNSDDAVGQIYNLTDGEFVSKRQFIEKIADILGLPRPHLTPPLWLAWLVTWCCDKAARVRGAHKAPNFNFTKLKFMGYGLDFSIEKAQRQLGYRPRYAFEEAMNETMAWYQSNYVTEGASA